MSKTLSTEVKTKHDPLCPNYPCSCEPDSFGHDASCNLICLCETLEKARVDEIEKLVKLLEKTCIQRRHLSNNDGMGSNLGTIRHETFRLCAPCHNAILTIQNSQIQQPTASLETPVLFELNFKK